MKMFRKMFNALSRVPELVSSGAGNFFLFIHELRYHRSLVCYAKMKKGPEKQKLGEKRKEMILLVGEKRKRKFLENRKYKS